ncbi:MAG: 2Fe-2S iron-sulfur cluster-binding protein [Acidimicrobiales bacterium]
MRAPQGQCGCCTVLVDGAAGGLRHPGAAVRGRPHHHRIEGLPPADAARWAEAFCATGASQCGFCSPGIVLRLHAEAVKPNPDPAQALLAHLCRCTGWLPILDAFALAAGGPDGTPVGLPATNGRDLAAASARATLEGASAQRVAPEVALGAGGFADDRTGRRSSSAP